MLEHHPPSRELAETAADSYAICPRCGAPAAHDVTRLVRGVWLADYLCSGGEHIWASRWVA